MGEFTHETLTELIKSIPIGATKKDAGTNVLSRLNDEDMKASRSIYFSLDRIDIWEELRSHPASTKGFLWVRQNLEHALQHCPKMVGHWAHFSEEESMVLVDDVGQLIDKDIMVTGQDRLAIFSGILHAMRVIRKFVEKMGLND